MIECPLLRLCSLLVKYVIHGLFLLLGGFDFLLVVLQGAVHDISNQILGFVLHSFEQALCCGLVLQLVRDDILLLLARHLLDHLYFGHVLHDLRYLLIVKVFGLALGVQALVGLVINLQI